MISVVIATHESERLLVPTLAALVPGAASGVVREVIVADANSKDATAEVADIAGCTFMTSDSGPGPLLAQAARAARSPWLLFLRAGLVPEMDWIKAAQRFIDEAADKGLQDKYAAAFRAAASGGLTRSAFAEIAAQLRLLLRPLPAPDQGLLMTRKFYDQLGGHPDTASPDAELLRRIGRRRVALLAAGITARR